MPHELYPQVAIRARHRCEYCHAPEELHSTEFEVEHINPRALGGGEALDNLALACRSCNVRKLQATRATDPLTGTLVPFFNPRLDVWLDHFDFVAATQEIVGKTEIGRATVQRLGLNRAHMLLDDLAACFADNDGSATRSKSSTHASGQAALV